MDKVHKFLFAAIILQTVVISGVVLHSVHPVVQHEVQTVEVVVTVTPTLKPGVSVRPTRAATPSGEVR